ncbi:ABC transporter permease [Catenulispora pinisilvae]|uniref:ABC transporter permease n=1 Tax=Catenulispora pinisilvae TaxID=2705253 RepID=UPI0018915399|nr:ABC transporter permease [Catenulispora pinisilvae]
MTLTPTADTPNATQPAPRPLATILAAQRPPRPTAWAACRVFAWRALLKIRHVPEQLSDVIAVPIIFTLLFTYLFGGALAGSTHRYLQTLLPGTLVMAVLLATMYTGINLNTDHAAGVYDRFRTLPIWRPAPIIGALLGDTARYLLASALVVGLGLALGFRPHGGAVGVGIGVALVVAFALALSWVFCWLGLVLRTPNAVTNLAFLVLFPLTMASNTFVDPHTLPGWLRAFVDANPVSHLVAATREAMAGTASGTQVGAVLLTALATIAVFAPLTMHAYNRKS